MKALIFFIYALLASLVQADPCVECYAQECISKFNQSTEEIISDTSNAIKSYDELLENMDINSEKKKRLSNNSAQVIKNNKKIQIITAYRIFKDCLNSFEPKM